MELSGFASAVTVGRAAMVASGQFVTFRCGDTSYGIPIMSVREIRSWQPTTTLPGRALAARGVLDIRGTVVEVFDLGALLGGSPVEPTLGSVVVVLALSERTIGLLVDAVSDIIQASAADLMPLPTEEQTGLWSGQVTAMVNHDGQLIGILDPGAVLP